jgi:hypothetical protein
MNLKNLFNGNQKIATRNAKNVKKIPLITAMIPPPSPGPKYKNIIVYYLLYQPTPKEAGDMIIIYTLNVFHFLVYGIPEHESSIVCVLHKDIPVGQNITPPGCYGSDIFRFH